MAESTGSYVCAKATLSRVTGEVTGVPGALRRVSRSCVERVILRSTFDGISPPLVAGSVPCSSTLTPITSASAAGARAAAAVMLSVVVESTPAPERCHSVTIDCVWLIAAGTAKVILVSVKCSKGFVDAEYARPSNGFFAASATEVEHSKRTLHDGSVSRMYEAREADVFFATIVKSFVG